MPFEKFKPPKLHGAIGSQIGKAQGVVIAKGLKAVTESTNQLRAKGCPGPAELAKLDSKLSNLATLSGTLNSNVSAFKAIPPSIKAPISGLLAAVDIILALPVPQAIGTPPGPPGGLIFAQPTNFTTKFADLLNLLKEFAAAMLITAEAIEASLGDVSGGTAAITSNLKNLEAPLKVCKIENSVKANLNKQQQRALGLLDDNGESILGNFGSKVLEKENTRPAKEQLQEKLKEELGVEIAIKGATTLDSLPKGEALNLLNEGTAFRLPPKVVDGETVNEIAAITVVKDENGNTKVDENGVPVKEVKVVTANLKPEALSGKAAAFNDLNKVLKNISDKLNNPEVTANSINNSSSTTANTGIDDKVEIPVELLENIKKDLEEINSELVTPEIEKETDPELFYKGYQIKILRTPESPVLAPRHFAAAFKDGKQEIKGPDSYSSSKEVLLAEIKFRIDNQLS